MSDSGAAIEVECEHCGQPHVYDSAQTHLQCSRCGENVCRKQAIESYLITVVAATFGYRREQVDRTSRLRDIGDSLGTIELLVKLETQFGITIEHEDIEELESVSEVARYIEQRLQV